VAAMLRLYAYIFICKVPSQDSRAVSKGGEHNPAQPTHQDQAAVALWRLRCEFLLLILGTASFFGRLLWSCDLRFGRSFFAAGHFHRASQIIARPGHELEVELNYYEVCVCDQDILYEALLFLEVSQL
jgi:hypothetical protein